LNCISSKDEIPTKMEYINIFIEKIFHILIILIILEYVRNKESVLILILNIIKRILMKYKDSHLFHEKEEHSNIQWMNDCSPSLTA